MGEQGRTQHVEVKIKEKPDAVPGERIRAVGMCFYKPVIDLVPGNVYQLCRNPQNPRDSSCIEIKDGSRVRATLNRDISQLLSSYLDTNTVEEPTWWVSFFVARKFWNVLAPSEHNELWSKIPFLSFCLAWFWTMHGGVVETQEDLPGHTRFPFQSAWVPRSCALF